MTRRIVITGMGAVTPVGVGVENYWHGLLSGACGIQEITRIDASGLPVTRAAQVTDFRPRDFLPTRLTSDLDTFMQYAYVSALEAIKQSGEEFDPNRTGIVMGTALAGLAHTGETQAGVSEQGKHVSPKFISKIMGNIAAAQLSINYGIKGPSLTVSTACSSGGDAVTMAAMLIEAGMADRMIVMAGESAISPLMIQSLTKSGALSKTGRSLPFDTERDGFVIGEGGGALVLETEESAKERGAAVLAELLGYANNTDAYNPVAPDPEGGGAARCMALALGKAGLQPEDIGYINAHGTATEMGDIAESRAVRAVFGGYAVPVGSTKGSTGHLMGAGGITELIACVKTLQTGTIPATAGCGQLDPRLELNIVYGENAHTDARAAMSNSLGFGGQNSSIIVGKFGG